MRLFWMNPMPKIQNLRSKIQIQNQAVFVRKSELGDIRKNSGIQDQMNLTDEVVLDESNA